MTDIAPGTYIIYNRALDPNGNKLAITFLSQGPAAEVQPLESSAIQTVCTMVFHSARRTHIFLQWIVGTSSAGPEQRIIVPITSQGLQLGGGSSVSVVPGTGSIWLIRLNNDGYRWVHITSHVFLFIRTPFFSIRNSVNDPTTTWGINVVNSPLVRFLLEPLSSEDWWFLLDRLLSAKTLMQRSRGGSSKLFQASRDEFRNSFW